MDKSSHSICLHCKEMFIPSPHAPRARYCSRAVCRKASKQASQTRWLNKPSNRDYFCGAHHVERVQAWRKAHPGYWRRGKARKRDGPLQDTVALQDLVHSPSFVALLGFLAFQSGDALQDSVEKVFWNMHSRGQAIIGMGSVAAAKERMYANKEAVVVS
jgi:hypothetical protein